MKKLFSVVILSLFYVTGLQAAGINMGVSLSGSVFEVDGGSEDFAAGHVSNTSGSAAVSKKASAEGDSAEGAFAVGSIFIDLSMLQSPAHCHLGLRNHWLKSVYKCNVWFAIWFYN